jgi:hypothetical protein
VTEIRQPGLVPECTTPSFYNTSSAPQTRSSTETDPTTATKSICESESLQNFYVSIVTFCDRSSSFDAQLIFPHRVIAQFGTVLGPTVSSLMPETEFPLLGDHARFNSAGGNRTLSTTFSSVSSTQR